MNKKHINPKKRLIRNFQVPLSNTNAKVLEAKCTQIRNEIRTDMQAAAGPSNSGRFSNKGELQTPNNKFSKPELNTCLGLVKKMKSIKQTTINHIETEGDLTPKSKQVYRHEITKVLNLPVDRKIYHHLIPLNVNDSMIIMQKKEKSKRRTYIPGTHTDLEPQLEDFLTQIEPIQLTFPLSGELDVIPKTNSRINFDYLQNLYAAFGPDS